MGGLGFIGILVLGSASIALWLTSTSAHTLGIKPGNPAKTNRENLLTALSGSARSITLPPGDYFLENSSPSDVVINTLGARFVFTNNSRQGLVFTGGAGPRFYGLRSVFKALPPALSPAGRRVAGISPGGQSPWIT